MAISRSYALPIDGMFIFKMYDINGELFLKATFLSALSFSFARAAQRYIAPFTTICASL